MSYITLQCRLIANESTRHQLWDLMAQKNTPLINELLHQVTQHPDFPTWQKRGKLPASAISQLCQPLKSDPRFAGQPARFYTSAIKVCTYIYQSWLAVQKRLENRRQGKIRWLEILKSDSELTQVSHCTLDEIRHKAIEILAQLNPASETPQSEPVKPQKTPKSKKKKQKASSTSKQLSDRLFETYARTKKPLTRCAIAYLLKNGCKITNLEEDPEKFQQRRRQVEIQIERLSEQINARLPKGRDLTDTKWLETLALATQTVPQNNLQAKHWQDILLSHSSSLPFPVSFETNEDMVWSQNEKGRLCVHFNGLSDQHFEIYCDQRQLKWFQRFLEDQQTKCDNHNIHSSSLFTLRSGRLAWQEHQGKGTPWNVHRLTLYCTVDTRLWTEEGTQQVRQEKADEIAKVLTGMKKKGDLNQNQQAFVKRKQTTLERINNSFERPSRPLYHGQSHIVVGVSLGLEKPATVAVVDALNRQTIVYRSTQQLLGSHRQMLNRQRRQQKILSHQRHKRQKRFVSCAVGESELGLYVDRVLAKAIIKIAQTYQAGSIVLPKLDNIREMIQSEIQAKAEQKCPGCLEAQQKYAQQYRASVHRWSYGRLIKNIHIQAAKQGLFVEQAQQPVRGSPAEKAQALAMAAYQERCQKMQL
jgi:hypothetical protein